MSALSRDEARALTAIAGGAGIALSEAGDRVALADGSDRKVSVPTVALAALARRGLVERRGDSLVATSAGRAALRRAENPDHPHLAQHLDLARATDGSAALIDLAESPLAQLMRRRGADGTAYLDRREFDAGERLRADFTRGQLMPRLGANWERPIADGRRGGAVADLSDGALSARMRVERALDAVGPELAGVLVDVCCFLKGLETVERERNWPVRSAKLMLKSALGALARHYEPAKTARRGGIVSWGTAGYRPTIGG